MATFSASSCAVSPLSRVRETDIHGLDARAFWNVDAKLLISPVGVRIPELKMDLPVVANVLPIPDNEVRAPSCSPRTPA